MIQVAQCSDFLRLSSCPSADEAAGDTSYSCCLQSGGSACRQRDDSVGQTPSPRARAHLSLPCPHQESEPSVLCREFEPRRSETVAPVSLVSHPEPAPWVKVSTHSLLKAGCPVLLEKGCKILSCFAFPEDLSVLLVQVWVASLATYEGHLIVNNAKPRGCWALGSSRYMRLDSI